MLKKLMVSTTFKSATISSETGKSPLFGPVLDFCLSKCEVKNQAKHVDSSSKEKDIPPSRHRILEEKKKKYTELSASQLLLH